MRHGRRFLASPKSTTFNWASFLFDRFWNLTLNRAEPKKKKFNGAVFVASNRSFEKLDSPLNSAKKRTKASQLVPSFAPPPAQHHCVPYLRWRQYRRISQRRCSSRGRLGFLLDWSPFVGQIYWICFLFFRSVSVSFPLLCCCCCCCFVFTAPLFVDPFLRSTFERSISSIAK